MAKKKNKLIKKALSQKSSGVSTRSTRRKTSPHVADKDENLFAMSSSPSSSIVVLPEPQPQTPLVPKSMLTTTITQCNRSHQADSSEENEGETFLISNQSDADNGNSRYNSVNEEESIPAQQPSTSSNLEDVVTPREKMPKWLVRDPYNENKWNFKMRRFNIKKYATNEELNEWDKVKHWSWDKFKCQVTLLATNIYVELSKCYKNGISSMFRRHLSGAVNLTFPHLEALYEHFRNLNSNEELPGVKKTTLKPDTFTEFFYFRLQRRFRYYLKKEAIQNGTFAPSKRRNGKEVAKSNRMRKRQVISQ